jgi:NAD(P)H-dependent FMN reductase
VVKDDFQAVYDKLVLADHIVLATPIYFMGVSAQAKQFIDRCQCLWALKYVHRLPLPPPHGGGVRQGHLISVGGSGGVALFQCAEKTFKYFLDALDAEMGTALLYSEVDEREQILEHPTALAEAFALGARLGSR